MGTFFKQIYRYTHPRAFRHNENIWPYVKIQRAASGEIIALHYRRKQVPLAQLSDLKGRFAGDVLLAATGPSVKNLRLEKFPAMPAMGVNGAYFLHERVDFRFYVIVDMGFIDKKPELIADIIDDQQLTLFTTPHGVVKIIEKFSLERIKCRFAVIEDAAFKIYQPKITNEELWPAYRDNPDVIFAADRKDIAFNYDIRNGVFDAGTVAYWALQLLTFLGFERLYIIGLDMNNFHQPRFYEAAENKLPTELENKVDELVMPAFQLASQLMKAKNITIKNLSVASAISSDIFDKVDPDEFFK
ncbi:lipopolysaccharide core biosynthesis protein [Serratia entomophila]|uniref:sugar glycosyltransferase n=1 Tax=Serratia entomophila TaxID=42906 RepID=UPI001F32CFD9|nr:sugar glycosyltransferase [Serratia entomophila]UIW18329.1 sugar glycosyltransferase [Serratia entomophila]CAI0796033.1 lipopolysaccharide core biosynthesis protein [Serratia entomophila]CAI1083923.1 lipopolysaccharide core biosynthesis protein [Serratia entomophila]CAI1086869.1 lipopolysaccharide core biosynthesis protein [Serratia entomophila]CAI1112060.1 lipopolysaccharide core biosynthesis protein [Serratia entomophila]